MNESKDGGPAFPQLSSSELYAVDPEVYQRLVEALKALERALRTDSRDKSTTRDTVEYHLDGQAMYSAINMARDALALARGGWMMDIDDYNLSLIEPAAADQVIVNYDTLLLAINYSTAVSLKRIADMLDGGGLASLLTQSVNNYGESFTDAIQMSLVRGQMGIDKI